MSGHDAQVTFSPSYPFQDIFYEWRSKTAKMRSLNFSQSVVNALYSLEKLVKNNPDSLLCKFNCRHVQKANLMCQLVVTADSSGSQVT